MGRILDAAAVYVLAMRMEPSSREYKRSHDALCTRVSLLRAAAAAPRSREEIQTLQLPVDYDYDDDDDKYGGGGGGGDDSDDVDFDKGDVPRPGPPERAQASDPNGRYAPRRLEELSLLALFRTGQVMPAGSVATTVQQEQLLRRAAVDGAIAAAGPGMDVCHGTRAWLLRKALELGLDLEAQLTHGERAESVTARGKALMTSEYEHLSRNEWSYGTVLVDATSSRGFSPARAATASWGPGASSTRPGASTAPALPRTWSASRGRLAAASRKVPPRRSLSTTASARAGTWGPSGCRR